MGICGICVAWTTGGNNQTASIFAAKLDWDSEETRFNNTLINFASQVGKALGALYGGRLIEKYGRRTIFVRFNILSILSCASMQIVTVFTIATGKFLNGFFVTVTYVAAIKMLNESVPVYLLSTYGTLCQTCTAVGYMLCLGLGLGLPSEDYNPALKDDPKNLAAQQADKDD